jgi:phosphohistidine phosphatase
MDASGANTTHRQPARVLVLARHARAVWASAGQSDEDRPLAPEGVRDAERLAAALRERGLTAARILASPAERAALTATILARGLGGGEDPLPCASLYSGGVAAYLEAVATRPDEEKEIVLVGHNPTLESVLMRLSGVTRGLAPGAAAAITFDAATWEDAVRVGGRLYWSWPEA